MGGDRIDRQMRASRLATAVFLGLAACGGEEPAAPGAAGVDGRWLDLARGYRPRSLEALAATLEAALQPPRGARISTSPPEEDSSVWFELPLPRPSWQRAA